MPNVCILLKSYTISKIKKQKPQLLEGTATTIPVTATITKSQAYRTLTSNIEL